MDNNTVYYMRVRHKGAVHGLSPWGATTHFKTKPASALAPSIVSPLTGTVDVLSSLLLSISAFSQDVKSVSIPKIDNGVVVGYVNADQSRLQINTEWQLSKTSNFSVIDKTTTTGVGVVDWLVSGLLENTSYYLRVRQNFQWHHPESSDGAGVITYSNTLGMSEWSQAVVFATKSAFLPSQPNITYPTPLLSGVYRNLAVTSSAFSSDGAAAHASTDWQASTQADFSTIAVSSMASTDLVASTLSGFLEATTYYVRCRHRDAAGGVSAWSAGVSFTTLPSFAPAKPTITNITNGVSKMGTSWFPVTSSAFSGKGTDTHASSSWQFSTTASFTAGTIVSSVTNSATDKTTFTPVGLGYSTIYYARVSHRGADGQDSPWSDTINFSITNDTTAFSSGGTFTLTVPNGITSAVLEAQGSGGGSGGGTSTASTARGAGGGSSGEYLTTTIAVVPGDTLTFTIGTGGAPGGTNGGNGVNTVIKKNGVTVLTGRGGKGSIGTAGGLVVGNGTAGAASVTTTGGKGGNSPSGGVGPSGRTLGLDGAAGTKGAGASGAGAWLAVNGIATVGARGGTGYASVRYIP